MTAAKGGGKKEREENTMQCNGEEKQRETEAGNDIDPITLPGDQATGFVLLPPPASRSLPSAVVVNGVVEIRRYHFTDPFDDEVDPGTKKTKGSDRGALRP